MATTGAGFASLVVMFLVGGYYNVIISYPIYYMYLSLTPTLPWMDCNNTWNTPSCDNVSYDTNLFRGSSGAVAPFPNHHNRCQLGTFLL